MQPDTRSPAARTGHEQRFTPRKTALEGDIEPISTRIEPIR
jgi:hypothetical protein